MTPFPTDLNLTPHHPTLIGMCVTDAWLCWKAIVCSPRSDIQLMEFVQFLCVELIAQGKRWNCPGPHHGPVPGGSTNPDMTDGGVHMQDTSGVVHIRVHTGFESISESGFKKFKQRSCRYCAVELGRRNGKTTWLCECCNLALCDEFKTGRPCFPMHMQPKIRAKLQSRKKRRISAVS